MKGSPPGEETKHSSANSRQLRQTPKEHESLTGTIVAIVDNFNFEKALAPVCLTTKIAGHEAVCLRPVRSPGNVSTAYRLPKLFPPCRPAQPRRILICPVWTGEIGRSRILRMPNSWSSSSHATIARRRSITRNASNKLRQTTRTRAWRWWPSCPTIPKPCGSMNWAGRIWAIRLMK